MLRHAHWLVLLLICSAPGAEPGSRFLKLTCREAGRRSAYDLGNWVKAGFVFRPAR